MGRQQRSRSPQPTTSSQPPRSSLPDGREAATEEPQPVPVPSRQVTMRQVTTHQAPHTRQQPHGCRRVRRHRTEHKFMNSSPPAPVDGVSPPCGTGGGDGEAATHPQPPCSQLVDESVGREAATAEPQPIMPRQVASGHVQVHASGSAHQAEIKQRQQGPASPGSSCQPTQRQPGAEVAAAEVDAPQRPRLHQPTTAVHRAGWEAATWGRHP